MQKSILISSFSSVYNKKFQNIINFLLHENHENLNCLSTEKISQPTNFVYIPTASYAPDVSKTKSLGEQRRRMRYEAKQKMHKLSELLFPENNIKENILLELDSPTITSEKIVNALKSALFLYIDGGNTFYLQKHLLETNFWNLFAQNFNKNSVYIGCSAGITIIIYLL
jgi:peptidase E